MKAKEMKDMSVEELNKELVASLREQFNLRMQHATRQLAKTDQLKKARRKIARLRTILNAQQVGQHE